MDENKIFLKTVEEKYERFLDYYTMMSSDFLSLEQQSALAGFLRAHSKENVYLFGGYPEAERRQVLFLPDYTGLAPQAQDADLLEYFRENPDDCPIALLDVRVASAAREKLTHRDYLGALMGEGIRRENKQRRQRSQRRRPDQQCDEAIQQHAHIKQKYVLVFLHQAAILPCLGNRFQKPKRLRGIGTQSPVSYIIKHPPGACKPGGCGGFFYAGLSILFLSGAKKKIYRKRLSYSFWVTLHRFYNVV